MELVRSAAKHALDKNAARAQVWKKGGWASGDETGFFVQVDSPDLKQVWFVACGSAASRKESSKPKAPVALDVDTFRLLPTLIDFQKQ